MIRPMSDEAPTASNEPKSLAGQRHLTRNIIIATVLGVIVGLALNPLMPREEVVAPDPPGQVSGTGPVGGAGTDAGGADESGAASRPEYLEERVSRLEEDVERLQRESGGADAAPLEPPAASASGDAPASGRGWPGTVVEGFLVDGLFQVVGRIFVSALQLLVVPLVFVSLVTGTASLGEPGRLGRIGVKTVAFYLATTAIAISLALVAAILIGPGVGFELPAQTDFQGAQAPPLTDVLVSIIPTNPVGALAEGNMLQIIVFAILFGLALTLAGRAGERIQALFEDLYAIVMQIVMIVIRLAPYGVFALIARTFAGQGFGAFAPLGAYMLTVLGVLLIHGLLTYPLLLKLLSGLDPVPFLKKMWEAQLFAFSTASSNATIPVTMETVETKLGVKNPVASFTVPLGATINMDGTAIMQGVATVFIAQAYQIDIGLAGYLTVILTATLASIGTAGVPSVGLIMLSMVLTQAGLPVEGVALIIGIDRLLDMVRTAVNITGDAAVSCIVARSEQQIDLATYDRLPE